MHVRSNAVPAFSFLYVTRIALLAALQPSLWQPLTTWLQRGRFRD